MPELLADILGRTARAFGSQAAVAEPGRSISYADLDCRSSEIAGALERSGITPGARIGIFRHKNIETIAAIYGVLKAGCAYVPIDPRTGPERLTTILRDAGVPLVFTEPVLAIQLEPAIKSGLIRWVAGADSGGDCLKFRDCAVTARPLRPASGIDGDPTAAYVLYTSGSTGVPKGVEHTHSSAVAFAAWAADHFSLASSDRVSCHAPLHFDLTTFDLFASVIKGACVVLIPDEIVMFPQRIGALIEKEQISVWYSVPFALMQLVDRGGMGKRNLAALRQIIFAGERYPPAALRRLAAMVPQARLTNLFGPTETNVCTCHHVTADDLASSEFCPIGKPCPFALLMVVDPTGQQVSPGERGELLVSGSSVMRGYLNRPDLNAQVFVQSANGAGFFRTGDLVTARKDGTLQFHGRLDSQVKVRGFRIELGEVETALLGCEGVAAAVAWVARDKNGLDGILAAVETAPGAVLAEGLLVHRLKRYVAQAALPHRIIVLDRLPRTTNGKIDFAALATLA
jgi:amino acid adenylation domain-containing protein